MKNLIFWLLISFASFVRAQSPEVNFGFNHNTGDQTVTESVSGLSYSILNHFNRPEYIDAIDGKALRLDGWSTYITSTSFSIPNINRKLSIETWYATEAFTKEPSSIIEWVGTNSGFYLSVGSYGEINFSYFIDGTAYVHNTPNRLTKYQWHHIVAIVDLDAGTTKIYVDNDIWFTKSDLTGTNISNGNHNLYIGKRNLNQTFDGFSTNTLNGAIDNINIYSSALDITTITNHFNLAIDRTVELVINPDIRHQNDYLRPRYHPLPNTSWANECYGLIYYNNLYHLFFQKNPNGPYLYFMHWGHLISPDLVNWKEERIALAPDANPGFDNFGVWSGTTVKGEDEIPKILYTGVNGQKAAIGIASSSDNALISWTKPANNPIIAGAPNSFPTMDFRDTYVWKEGSTYYMIIGSGINGNGGGIVFCYKSTDLINWTIINPLHRDINTVRSGIFWEMPFFYKLDETTFILGVNPVPTPGIKAKVLYWLGKWENEKFTPYDPNPKTTEFLPENLLAPALSTDKEGNTTYIGIIPEDRSVSSQIAAGWRNTFSLPRELRLLTDSTVGHVPHRNLCRLRGVATEVVNRQIEPATSFNIPEAVGNQIELDFTIKADSASVFSIQVLKHADAQEFTSLKFDLKQNMISLDRRFSSFTGGVKNLKTDFYRFDFRDSINVRIFLDHSVLEVFVDKLIVLSARIYPSREECNKVDLILNEGGIKLISLKKWDMADLGTSNSESVCVSTQLPTSLRKEKKNNNPITSIKEEVGLKYKLFPIPASDKLYVQSPDMVKSDFEMYSLTGQLVLQKTLSATTEIIPIAHLSSGIYVGKIYSDGDTKQFKIIIQH